MLEGLFKEADAEGTGQLSLPEVIIVLERLGTSDAIQLSEVSRRGCWILFTWDAWEEEEISTPGVWMPAKGSGRVGGSSEGGPLGG